MIRYIDDSKRSLDTVHMAEHWLAELMDANFGALAEFSPRRSNNPAEKQRNKGWRIILLAWCWAFVKAWWDQQSFLDATAVNG